MEQIKKITFKIYINLKQMCWQSEERREEKVIWGIKERSKSEILRECRFKKNVDKVPFGQEKKISCEALRVDWHLACQITIFWANKATYNVGDNPEIKTSGSGILTDVVVQKLPELHSPLDAGRGLSTASAQDNIPKGTLKNTALFAQCLVHYSSGKACFSDEHCNTSYGV